ncbi:unnamed protein product [Diamesa tonsa]
MSGPQNSEKVKLLISKLRKSIKTIVNIDDLLPILDEFYIFLTTESKQLPASKVKNFILKILYLFKSAIKANKFIDDNETKTIFKHKLCKIISFYIDVELFSVGIGKDSSDNITNRISTTIDSYFNEPENILKIFRASLQIRKGKQIMRFRDIVIALFTKYFYRQARAQPLITDDVLFLEQLSLYKIWSSLLDSQAHKDELIEMVVNHMVPQNKQILMSQLGITNADNFMNEALKTTSQQVIEKVAIINNTDIIDLDPEISDSYVSSNINETLLKDLEHEQTVDKVCKPISWLDELSMETSVKLIEKRVIIEIDDDDDDDDVMEMVEPSKIDVVDIVIDLNFVKNLSLDDEVGYPQKHEIISEVCVNDEEFEDKVQINEIEKEEEIKVQINEREEEEFKLQTNDENFLKSDILRTYSRKEKPDIAYRSSIDTMEIGTMTDLSAHTKETEMCVENEMSSTEPDMSQHCNTSNVQMLNDDSNCINNDNDLFINTQSNEPVVEFNLSQTTLNLTENNHLINTSNSHSPFKLEPMEPAIPITPIVFSSPSTFFSSYNYPLLKQNDIKPPEISHSTEPEVETTLPFKKRRTMSIYVECPNRNDYDSCDSIQQSTKKSPVPSDQQVIEPCSNIALTLAHEATTSYPSTPMISIATIAHLLHENNPANCQQQITQNTHSYEAPPCKRFQGKAQNNFNNLVVKPNCVPTPPEQHFYHKNHQMQHNANPPIDYHNYHGPSLEPVVNSTGSFNNRSRYDVKSLNHPQFNNSLDTALLQYEVSPRRNRIDVVIGSVKKPKIKSVRFADEEVTRNKTPMETHYGTTVDSITALDNYLKNAKLKERHKICHSFVLLERNITCERMAARKTSTLHKKCLKLPENWENIKRKYVNTGNSPYEPPIDERIYDEISSNSEHSYSSEGSDDSDSEDEEFESHKSVDDKTIESLEETDPNETKMLCYVLDNNTDGMEVDEDLYDKAQIMLKSYRADCKDPVENYTKTSSEDEELNSDKSVEHFDHHVTDIITDTECIEETDTNETEMLCYVLSGSNEEIDVDELSNLYENESLEQMTQTTSLPQSPITVDVEFSKTGSESISINSEQITSADDRVSEDEELNSDTDADLQENTSTGILGIEENIESNPSEMLCFVPESSPKKMIVDDDELTNLYNKTHQSLDNQEHQELKSDDEEFSQTESQSINSNSDLITQSISESTSLNFEQISDSEDEISEDEEFNLDTIVDHNGNSKIEMLDSEEKTESSAGELLCCGLDSNHEKMIVDEDELPNLYNNAHPSLENQEPPGQSTMEEECSQTESQSTNSHSDLITHSVSKIMGFEQVSATGDDVSKDEDTIVEFLDDTSDSDSEKSLISVYQLNDEYDETASQFSQKLDETVEELEEYKISVEQLTEDCKIVSIVRMDEEHDDAMEQLSSECDIPVERINDEMTNDYEEHLQEMKRNCDKNEYIHDNNNIAGFRAIEMNNYQKISKHNSYNPATGDYIEAYVNYVNSETIPATNQDLLLPLDFVMSPPSTPDSTSQPKIAVIKKRGRPKGSKNRKRPFVRTLIVPVVESPRIHPQYPINMKTYSKATTNNLYKATF